jgi:predicted negative regulator of RcsB-dependent stress response
MDEEKSAANQVKDAVWWYTQATIVLLLLFGAGLFLGWQLWGSGEAGAVALRAQAVVMDQDFNRIKNEREGCQKVLEVTRIRQAATEKELAALKAGSGTP